MSFVVKVSFVKPVSFAGAATVSLTGASFAVSSRGDPDRLVAARGRPVVGAIDDDCSRDFDGAVRSETEVSEPLARALSWDFAAPMAFSPISMPVAAADPKSDLRTTCFCLPIEKLQWSVLQSPMLNPLPPPPMKESMIEPACAAGAARRTHVAAMQRVLISEHPRFALNVGRT